MSYDVYNLYEEKKISNRDEMIQEVVGNYLKSNASVLSDGIINNIPILSATFRDKLSQYYNISDNEFKDVRKNKEFKIFKREESISQLKLGLIISYIKTGKPIFLNFLAIQLYSSLYFKYFRNGKNAAVLKYTIETQDNRTDFKRYEMSLITVVIKKVEVIIDHIKKSKFIDANGKASDYGIRMIFQAILTRFNSMLRTICNKYLENMRDDNVKIMLQYSKTLDGKDVISPLNIVETVRDTANDTLRVPSYTALTMCKLNIDSAKKYKDFFLMNYNNNFIELTEINSMIINEYLKRHPKLDIGQFKNKFVKDMSTARNINHILDRIDNLYDKDVTPEMDKRMNRKTYQSYVYDFLLANDVLAIIQVVKNK